MAKRALRRETSYEARGATSRKVPAMNALPADAPWQEFEAERRAFDARRKAVDAARQERATLFTAAEPPAELPASAPGNALPQRRLTALPSPEAVAEVAADVAGGVVSAPG